MATELTDLILALRAVYLKVDNDDLKRAISLLGTVVEHQIEPTERDLKLLATLIAEVEDEDEEDDDDESDKE
jgi:hypothetical protein